MSTQRANGRKPRRCYICKSFHNDEHTFYPGLCSSCGDLNWEKRHQRADLSGRVALVTGGRSGIGRGVVLRLLRDGATVLVTSRFPRNAAQSFASEADFDRWKERLQVYFLDLKHITAVEQFAEYSANTLDRLDIIINNAAQTVRYAPSHYEPLRTLEEQSFCTLPETIQRVCAPGPTHFSIETPVSLTDKSHSATTDSTAREGLILQQLPAAHGIADGNSWLLRDDQVTVAEIMEAHVINAVAPFVLNSRLKKLLAHVEENTYIINVSSSEGSFSTGDKSWRHPHTNMAKASLNMMTFTCAGEYSKHGIFMNSVDPGWVSLQHESQRTYSSIQPIFDTVDAAARICDPIYRNTNHGEKLFGKNFKHYTETGW